MDKEIQIALNNVPYPLNLLIDKEGIVEYIRDYYSALNGYLSMLYTEEDFYIAEDTTYQPWLSIMGNITESVTEESLYDKLVQYIENDKYIAVYTNIEQVSKLLQKMKKLTYHEDFFVAYIPDIPEIDSNNMRLATIDDLPFIIKTYQRSGYEQLLNRIRKKQMWVLENDKVIKGYAGIHKDCSLGFEYVAPNFR
ncbi:MAG: hypothetical protein V8S74_03900 [Lachnospirales bacterium]